MLIPNKFNGYARDGRRLYAFGGGDSSAPTNQTVTQTNVPEYARPYVEDILGRTQALSTQNTFQNYGGPRVAGTEALQQRSYDTAWNMQPAAQLGQATNIAQQAGAQALARSRYTPGSFTPGNSPANVFASPVANSVGTVGFNGAAAQQYMNPYMQQVVDIQKREAARQSDMLGEQQNAQAVGAGAFGGSRNAIVQAERERNLGQQMNDIQAQGSNAAFQQAQQQFNTDAGRFLQAGMANQGANLQAAGQNLQGQMANQGAGLTFNNQRLEAQQLGEQSRQFGANLGLQGLNTQLQSANLLRDIGQNQYNQQLGIAGLQNQFGTQQQTQQQMGLDAAYQDFVNRQMFPYRQLEFANNIVRGNYSPNTTTSVYSAPPSPISQVAGLGLAGAGIARMMAKGGVVDVESREVPDDEVGGIVDLLIAEIQ